MSFLWSTEGPSVSGTVEVEVGVQETSIDGVLSRVPLVLEVPVS